jgi:5-methyltetrahydrofolate--homocysteine methyltransferase
MTQATQDQLISALVELEEERVGTLVSQGLASGTSPLSMVEAMRQGMLAIGERYAAGTYFLSELIMAGEIFKSTMAQLEPMLASDSGGEAGSVVMATVKGDIHDIGKDIVVAMLRGAGYRVHDLGVDVPAEHIVDKLQETGAPLLGLSALITTSFDSMKTTIEAITQAGLRDRVKIIIGGGPVDEKVRTYVGADFFGRDAQDAVRLASALTRVEA